jgi:hypothetical protein
MDIIDFILYALKIVCWFLQYPCIYIFKSFVFGKGFTDPLNFLALACI